MLNPVQSSSICYNRDVQNLWSCRLLEPAGGTPDLPKFLAFLPSNYSRVVDTLTPVQPAGQPLPRPAGPAAVLPSHPGRLGRRYAGWPTGLAVVGWLGGPGPGPAASLPVSPVAQTVLSDGRRTLYPPQRRRGRLALGWQAHPLHSRVSHLRISPCRYAAPCRYAVPRRAVLLNASVPPATVCGVPHSFRHAGIVGKRAGSALFRTAAGQVKLGNGGNRRKSFSSFSAVVAEGGRFEATPRT